MTTEARIPSALPANFTEVRKLHRGKAVRYVLLFLASSLLLFLAMPRHPMVYDEGIMLVGAMRILAGQFPYRDFYAIYGPAEFYIYAGLFKLFGTSLLIARLFDITIESLTIISLVAIVRLHASRLTALSAAAVVFLWMYALEMTTGAAIVPVCLCSLVGTALLLPMFTGPITRLRLFAAGALAGVAFLFRLDGGSGIVAVHICIMIIAVFLYQRSAKPIAVFISSLMRYSIGFVSIILVPALYLFSVSALGSLWLDIFQIQKKIYYRNRNLPFPHLHAANLELVGVYLPIAVVAITFLAVLFLRRKSAQLPDPSLESQSTRGFQGFLIAFGLLCFIMFFKGAVRVTMVHMYMAIIPATMLIAVLITRGGRLPKALHLGAIVTGFAFLYAAVHPALRERRFLAGEGTVPQRILDRMLHRSDASTALETRWCDDDNPFTRGFCFTSDAGRREAILFIESHTHSGDRLFVGPDHHDRVFANDNLIYFATQRIPATKWSHYDPGLQTTAGIQKEMIDELEQTRPPYVVVDSEYDAASEPNDSIKSSGVNLMDDYIRQNYQPVQQFGTMSVRQRIQ